MPPAARVTLGELTVLIGYQPAGRIADVAIAPPDAIAVGDPTVVIGYKPAARLGDPTKQAGPVTLGCNNVLIGMSPQGGCLGGAAGAGSAFVTKAK